MDRKDGKPRPWPHQGRLLLSCKVVLKCKVQGKVKSGSLG